MPLTWAGGIARKANWGAARLRASAVISTSTPWTRVNPSTRDARLTVRPIAVNSIRFLGADDAHNGATPMNPDAQAQFGQAGLRQFLIVYQHLSTHRQCRPDRVVGLPRIAVDGAEQREDPIADKLGDMAVVAADRRTHALKVAIEQRHDDFGLDGLTKRSEPSQIGEQNGDVTMFRRRR
jgi:hypothetical protein